jgi:hypothetical protein
MTPWPCKQPRGGSDLPAREHAHALRVELQTRSLHREYGAVHISQGYQPRLIDLPWSVPHLHPTIGQLIHSCAQCYGCGPSNCALFQSYCHERPVNESDYPIAGQQSNARVNYICAGSLAFVRSTRGQGMDRNYFVAGSSTGKTAWAEPERHTDLSFPTVCAGVQ